LALSYNNIYYKFNLVIDQLCSPEGIRTEKNTHTHKLN